MPCTKFRGAFLRFAHLLLIVFEFDIPSCGGVPQTHMLKSTNKEGGKEEEINAVRGDKEQFLTQFF